MNVRSLILLCMESVQKLKELNKLLGEATLATYAGGGPETESERLGHKELEYKNGDWIYRDSYAGHFKSWGQEIVWYKDKPFWTQLYGGGMTEKYHGDGDFTEVTFVFLKQALSAGEKSDEFQPRGPRNYRRVDYRYRCSWEGDITLFKGSEEILYKNETVFTHEFIGGLFHA